MVTKEKPVQPAKVFVLVSVSVLILLIGWVLETHFGKAWFQRSGAFLTIYSVLVLIFSDRAERASANAQSYSEFLQTTAHKSVEDAERRLEERQSGNGLASIPLEELEERLREAIAFERSSLAAAKAYLDDHDLAQSQSQGLSRLSYFATLLGTVVWAVGDLITGCIAQLETATCSS